MGRLDELDLSKSLTRKEEARELDRAWERLTQLRLTLGGLIGTRELGPPVCVVFEGWDASGKGGAIKRLVAQMDPQARPGRAVLGADRGREAPSLPVAVLPAPPRMGRDGGLRSLLVRAGAGRAGRGLRHARAVATGVRRDQQLRADARATRE